MAGHEERAATGDRTLWLVGMMGSGKSTVGPMVADALGRSFVDADLEIEASESESVAVLLARDERMFREVESRVIADVAGRPVVAAAGGGAVLDEGNVSTMRGSGIVVWLDAPLGVLADRVGAGEGRPLLGDDPPTALERILAERIDRYRAAAHVVVAADTVPAAVASAIVAAWRSA